MTDKVKYTHIAFYNADWDTQLCKSFKEAQEFLKGHYEYDGTDEGFTEETVNGWDYIAEITHRSNYIVDDEKSNYADEEEWLHEADTAGHIEIVPIEKPSVTPERLAEIMYSIEHSSDIYEIKIPYTIHLAHELLKTLDIREKE
jgi:hypothetical protein